MRMIVYTGKGGVGKTSVAAATATRLAADGLRTLVVSTDAAHSLADSLDLPLGPEPKPVGDRLWGQEVDSLREAERSWGSVQRWLTSVMQWAQVSDINAEELLVFPGMEELFSLMQLREQADSGKFDAIVVDYCAPTGETLRLLSFPSVLHWWLEKVLPVKKRFLPVARPIARMVTRGLELPSDEVVGDVEKLFRELEKLQRLMLDPETTSVRMVVNPEKMVIAEARRSFTYLNLFGFNTDAVVVNRVLPPGAAAGYMAGWGSIQTRYLEEINAAFNPLPILQVPLMETEVVGLPMLGRVAAAAFGNLDPAAILYRGRTEELEKSPDGYVLTIALPFAMKDELNLMQHADELTIHVGSYKRKVTLPRTLAGRPVLGARLAEQRLRIRFGERPAGTAKGG